MDLRFRTRNYKHEAALAADHPRWVGRYSDALWDALCRRIAEHGFNGLVLYAGYHPFEYFLDYRTWPEITRRPESEREATRAALRRGLAIARGHGLKTFLQHYVGHFTAELAGLYGIPTTGRHSWTEHPAVTKYCRLCYREVFSQILALCIRHGMTLLLRPLHIPQSPSPPPLTPWYCVVVGIAIGIGIEKTTGALMASDWFSEARRRGTTPFRPGPNRLVSPTQPLY
jgi:hypothetical protein